MFDIKISSLHQSFELCKFVRVRVNSEKVLFAQEMEESGYYEVPDEAMRQIIRKDLKEDPKKLERQIELFKEWLRCEPYLPKDVGKHISRTSIHM